MRRPRAKSYADRLPPLVPREETDIAHLSEEMADVLYPGRRPRPFRLALEYDAFTGPGAAEADALARGADLFRTIDGARGARVHAGFDWKGARRLRELYEIVARRPGTEVLVDGKRVPYAAELWLPLMSIFEREEDVAEAAR